MTGTWILSILTTLAVGLGYRASINLSLSRLQKDDLTCYFLAKSGIMKTRAVLQDDSQREKIMDHIRIAEEAQACQTIFENMEIIPDSKNAFTTRVSDEEAKININSASGDLISILLQKSGVSKTNAMILSEYICSWRGDENMSEIEMDTFKNFKKSPFQTTQELMLIFDHFYKNTDSDNYPVLTNELYEKIKDLVTVYPADENIKTNINTVSSRALEALIESSIARLKKAGTSTQADPTILLNKIIEYRGEREFEDTNLDKALHLSEQLESDFIKITNEIKNLIGTTSQNFRIESVGKAAHTAATYRIESVFNLKDEKTLYWHEN